MESTFGVRPIGMLVLGAVIYALVFPFNKLAAEAGAPFFAHAFWQTFIAGAVLFVIARARGEAVPARWPHLRAYLVVGAFGFGLPMALLTFVAPNLPAGIVSLVLALSPTFTYLISVVVRLDRLAWLGVAGILLGFAGVAVILGPDAALPAPEMFGWFLLALVTPVCLAIANVSAAALRPPETTSTVMGAGFLLGAGAVLLPLMLISGQFYAPMTAAQILPTLGAVAVNGAFIVLFAEIVRRYGPTFFAQFNYLAVVAAIGWAAVFFGERPSWYLGLALALMAVGVVVSELRHKVASKQGA